MKPALHFIWSPFLFSITGFLIACGIAHYAPTANGEPPYFERFMFVAMPAVGIVIGWFIAYIATPISTRPDTRFISEAIAAMDAGGEPAGLL